MILASNDICSCLADSHRGFDVPTVAEELENNYSTSSNLTTVFPQQAVVMSTIWRYVYNNRYDTYKSSMYAGILLDTYDQFLRKFVHTPDQLYTPVLGRDYVGTRHDTHHNLNCNPNFRPCRQRSLQSSR